MATHNMFVTHRLRLITKTCQLLYWCEVYMMVRVLFTFQDFLGAHYNLISSPCIKVDDRPRKYCAKIEHKLLK